MLSSSSSPVIRGQPAPDSLRRPRPPFHWTLGLHGRRQGPLCARRMIAEACRADMVIWRVPLVALMTTALTAAALTGCAGIGLREPLRVSLAGLEPLSGEGLEARFVAKIRVQNPNDGPV